MTDHKKKRKKFVLPRKEPQSKVLSKNKRRKGNPTQSPSSSSSLPSVTKSSSSFAKESTSYPLPYPESSSKLVPKGAFLRFEEPYKESFQAAIDTAYLGFEIDLPTGHHDKNQDDSFSSSKLIGERHENHLFNHDNIEKALLIMDKNGLFRTDVTQPFGLGTRCAKTYVTRCLLGEEGTTYKYLGLRMFAHPWKNSNHENKQKKGNNVVQLEDALHIVSELNDSLTQRTVIHLNALDIKRKKIMQSTKAVNKDEALVKGRAKFDVALINRMIDTNDLKREPSMGDGRCSVSWHADSSLEHFSSIGVYHTILSQDKVDNFLQKKGAECKNETKRGNNHDDSSDRWSVALRVAHNSEGPESSKRGTDIESAVVTSAPPIAISLPSRSSYYLLDDFNHHHQHAVLVNDNDKSRAKGAAGIRFASTHRLLRESHNVHFILNRCKTACKNFNKKGPKIWRSEQLLLTEIESEWIRQFFIQGQGHKANLWKVSSNVKYCDFFASKLSILTKSFVLFTVLV